MGTVYKLTDKFRRRPWVAAKNGQVIGYYERSADALGELEKLTGKHVSTWFNITLSQAFDEWSNKHYKGISAHGISLYKNAYRHLAPLQKHKLRDITLDDYQKILDDMKESGLKRNTLKPVKSLVIHICDWAIGKDVIASNYGRLLDVGADDKTERQVFTDEEIDALKTENSETAWVVLILIYTGMRISELFNLKIENIHDGYCVGGGKTNAGRNRVIPILSDIREYIETFKRRAKNETLISGYNGKHSVGNFRRQEYHPLLKKLGISSAKTPHCTRHTFITRAINAGVPLEKLEKIVGHVDYDSTRPYYHSNPEALIEAIKILEY
jgi:integrase